MAKNSLEDLHEIRRGVASGQSREESRRTQRWRKPEDSRFKANFDATYDAKRQKMGAGIIVIGRNGDVMASMAIPIYHVTSPFIAESYAIWKTIDMCTRLGFREVVLEGDAKVVINIVNTKEEDES
ncbi:uncharacterized protein LOC122301662 [Carya illinoinensis]|uniref:uncharacterized protein LOC122301662 n=1 Tax=Carya illinoinensis TaxID=32201 RepID=UPI001C726253|nr:uncharacterized protein LOC122301662 [Carya illinoinensis]